MSVVMLEEYKSAKFREDRKLVLEERSKILQIAAKKAQDKTLTLQETTDLFAKFNSTYEASYEKKLLKEDESWALKLIQESVEESLKHNVLDTKINGIPVLHERARFPVERKVSSKPKLEDIKKYQLPQDAEDDVIKVAKKPKLRDSFMYENFYLSQMQVPARHKRSNQALATALTLSIIITLSSLIGISIFL